MAGNWKMNKTSEEARSFLGDFKLFVKDARDCDIVICAPFTLLPLLKKELENTNIKVGAQNIFYEDSGAYTGEVSALMVKEFCSYVIIGHSERRKYFNETNEIVNKKVKKALERGLKVIFCLGETLEEREKGITKQIVETQLREGLSKTTIENIVIAYEPVWAIGTGKTATPAQAEEVHIFLRELLRQLYNQEIADSTRIIYGGSVNQENASAILNMPNIDGCLPGGASLEASSFSNIIKS